MGSVDVVLHRLEQQLHKYKERVMERHRNSDTQSYRKFVEPEIPTRFDATRPALAADLSLQFVRSKAFVLCS